MEWANIVTAFQNEFVRAVNAFGGPLFVLGAIVVGIRFLWNRVQGLA